MLGKPTLRNLFWPVVTGVLLAIIILLLYPRHFGFDNQPPAGKHLAGNSPISYAEAVQRATPAVVNIYTSTVVQREAHPLFTDPLLRHFLNQGNNPQQQRLQQSLGSGVIVDNRGYIITNNHVIAGADKILVSLYDRRESLATVIGTDPDTDLAVLKIELEDIEAITFGRSADVRVGDIVLAIGNPFGFGQTVTQGIISATGRYGLNLNTYENYLQTDADINPGNSGGALINPLGELVGINAAIFSRSGGSQGIGLAIPAENAKGGSRQYYRPRPSYSRLAGAGSCGAYAAGHSPARAATEPRDYYYRNPSGRAGGPGRPAGRRCYHCN